MNSFMAYRHLGEDDLQIIFDNQELDLHTWYKRDPVLMKEFIKEDNPKENDL